MAGKNLAGRPLKESIDYFQHDTTMSHDEKIEALEASYGNDGYAVYNKLLEKIYYNNGEYCLNDPVKLLSAAKMCNVTSERFLDIVASCVSFGLFDSDSWEENKSLTSERIRRQVGIVRAERERDRGRKSPEKSGISQLSGDIPAGIIRDNEDIPPDNGHIRVDQSILDQSISKEKSDFFETPPTNPIKINAATRIEKARAHWNELAPIIGPECRLMAIQFKPEDSSDCLRVMSVYSDDEIYEAMENYYDIKTSSEHDIKNRYQSMVGFLRGGVEKFVTSANPREQFRKQAPAWEKPAHGVFDDRPDATTPEEIERKNALAAEEAMSPEDYAAGLEAIREKLKPKFVEATG